jgi:hypothetical protein
MLAAHSKHSRRKMRREEEEQEKEHETAEPLLIIRKHKNGGTLHGFNFRSGRYEDEGKTILDTRGKVFWFEERYAIRRD